MAQPLDPSPARIPDPLVGVPGSSRSGRIGSQHAGESTLTAAVGA